MKILSIDLGTKTGWAVIDQCGTISFGTWNLKPDRWANLGARCFHLKTNLQDIHKRLDKIDMIIYEEVRRHMGTDAAHCYGALLGALQEFCELNKVACESVPVGTIKKHATGKGNASKAKMIEAAKAKGWNVKDDNQADALWILDWKLEQIGG